MKHRTLFLFLAAVSLLGPVQACSSASKAADVATDQPAHADYSAPEGAIMARDAALTYVEPSMDVSGLTSISDWRGQDGSMSALWPCGTTPSPASTPTSGGPCAVTSRMSGDVNSW